MRLINVFDKRFHRIVVALVLCIFSFSQNLFASAIDQYLKKAWLQHILQETQQGKDLLRLSIGKSSGGNLTSVDLQKIASTLEKDKAVLKDFEANIIQFEKTLSPHLKNDSLNELQKRLLIQTADDYFKKNSKLLLQYFQMQRFKNLQALGSEKAVIAETGPELVALGNLPEISSIPMLAETGTRFSSIKNFFTDMQKCVSTQSVQERKSQDLRYILTGLGISETFTVGGYIIGTGVKDFSIKDLSQDVLMTGLWSMISGKLASGQASFRVRWLRVTAYGQMRSTLDSVIYYVSPITDTRGLSIGEATYNRITFNTGWNTATSWIPVSLYSLISGLQCLYPGATTQAVTTAMRLGQSATTSTVYYTLRHQYLTEKFSQSATPKNTE